MGVIDDYSTLSLEQKKINAVIKAVGHPSLELIKNKTSVLPDTKNILFVSQPDLKSKDYTGLFHRRFNESTVLDILLNTLNNLSVEVAYRPHPKEKFKKSLPNAPKPSILFSCWKTFS